MKQLISRYDGGNKVVNRNELAIRKLIQFGYINPDMTTVNNLGGADKILSPDFKSPKKEKLNVDSKIVELNERNAARRYRTANVRNGALSKEDAEAAYNAEIADINRRYANTSKYTPKNSRRIVNNKAVTNSNRVATNNNNNFDVKAFQNWVLQRNAFNKSKGYAINSLGRFGVDGIMGRYTRNAYNALKNEYNRFLKSGLTNYSSFYNKYIYKSPQDVFDRTRDDLEIDIQNRMTDTEINPVEQLKVSMPIIPEYTHDNFVQGRTSTIRNYSTGSTPLSVQPVNVLDLLNLSNTTKFALGGRMIPKYLNAGKLDWIPDYSQFQGKDEYWFKDAWLPLFDLWSAKAHFDNFFRPLFLKAVADNKIPSNLDYNTVRDAYFEDYMNKYYSQENTFPFRNAYRKNLIGPNGTQENWYFVQPNRFDPNGEWINYGNYNSNKYINGVNAYQNVKPEDADSNKKLETSPKNIKNVWKGKVIEKNGKYYGYNPKTKHLFELQKEGNVYLYLGNVGNAVQVDPNTASSLGYIQNTDGTFSLRPEEPPKVTAQPTTPTSTGLTELLVQQIVLDALVNQQPQPTEENKKPAVKEEPAVKKEPEVVEEPVDMYAKIKELNTNALYNGINNPFFRGTLRRRFNDAASKGTIYDNQRGTGSDVFDTNVIYGYGNDGTPQYLDSYALFNVYDRNGNGKLSRREMRALKRDVKNAKSQTVQNSRELFTNPNWGKIPMPDYNPITPIELLPTPKVNPGLVLTSPYLVGQSPLDVNNNLYIQ